jgi:DUF3037 family protein
MAPTYKCELRNIYWMPNLERAERIVAGLMMFADEMGFARVKFTEDRQRLQCFDPAVDLELFPALEQWFNEKISDPESRAKFLEKVPDWASNALQLSAPTALLSSDPAAEFEMLAKRYFVTPRLGPQRRETERERTRRKMVETWKKYDLWNLMLKGISMRDYLPEQDIDIDCGYIPLQPNSLGERELKMFHALAIEEDADATSELIASYPAFSAALQERMQVRPMLTTVTSDFTGEEMNETFSRLNSVGINSVMLRDLPAIAGRARHELGLREM